MNCGSLPGRWFESTEIHDEHMIHQWAMPFPIELTVTRYRQKLDARSELDDRRARGRRVTTSAKEDFFNTSDVEAGLQIGGSLEREGGRVSVMGDKGGICVRRCAQ